jgi:sterol 3beta-glucosyltransferase
MATCGHPMRIAILTLGSRGDVQPYVALGAGLKAAGHAVSIATSITFEPFIRRRGLDFVPIAGDVRELLETDEGLALLHAGGNPIHLIRRVARLVRVAEPPVEQMLRDVWQACQGADRIVFAGLMFYYGDYLAPKLRVPLYLSSHGPKTPTCAFHQLWFPAPPAWLPIGKGVYNQLTHYVVRQLLWQFGPPLLNKAWRKVFGGPPLPYRVPKQRLPTLYCYSPAVVPKPTDWGDNQHVTGYWFLDCEPDWQPPADLIDFLQSGPPPVYVGFGSMSNCKPEEVTDIVLQALKRSGQRGVLVTGWGGLSNADLPDDVFKLDSIPHDWLFPQTSAIIHHGGAGTTGAGLRAGVPSIVVPFFADQPFWGQRVYALGVGPRPIPLKRLSVARLAEAITVATSDTEMQRRAAALSQQIQAENGVKRAVELVCREGAS